MIRPAGKKDVTVTIDGLDFNTPDGFVIDYLNKFGVVLTNAVVYTKYDSGPLKGKFNGERKFQVDFSKSARQMGTYHLIDGSKVARDCPEEAFARNCAAGGLFPQHLNLMRVTKQLMIFSKLKKMLQSLLRQGSLQPFTEKTLMIEILKTMMASLSETSLTILKTKTYLLSS